MAGAIGAFLHFEMSYPGGQSFGSQLAGLQLAFTLASVWLTVLAVAVFEAVVLAVLLLEQAVLLLAQAALLAVQDFLVAETVFTAAVLVEAVLVQAVFLAQQAGLDCAFKLVAIKEKESIRVNTKLRFFIGK